MHFSRKGQVKLSTAEILSKDLRRLGNIIDVSEALVMKQISVNRMSFSQFLLFMQAETIVWINANILKNHI